MSYPTHLMHLAEQIDPFIFCHYLQDNNWKVFERKRTDIRIYQMDTKTDFYQIIIPLDKKLSDYTQAMYDATETAASAENLPLEELIHLLLPLCNYDLHKSPHQIIDKMHYEIQIKLYQTHQTAVHLFL